MLAPPPEAVAVAALFTAVPDDHTADLAALSKVSRTIQLTHATRSYQRPHESSKEGTRPNLNPLPLTASREASGHG